jgi:hypothetical protein
MSCFTKTSNKGQDFEKEIENDHYESVQDISDYYAMNKNKKEDFYFSVLDFKEIVNSIPRDIFNIFSYTINVFSSEEKTFEPCEIGYIRTNIKIKPYFPLNVSITFQGVVNGVSFKSSNQTIIPLNEEFLCIRVQNFNQNTQSLPKYMPLGKIVITSKEHWDL